MPLTGTWPDSRLKELSIESKNTKFGVLMKELCKLQAMKKISSITLSYIWMDFRLKGLSIESKNVRIGVRMRKLWSFEVKPTDFA